MNSPSCVVSVGIVEASAGWSKVDGEGESRGNIWTGAGWRGLASNVLVSDGSEIILK